VATNDTAVREVLFRKPEEFRFARQSLEHP
jgi:hypothetical protein